MLVPYGYFETEAWLSGKLRDALALARCVYRGTDLMEALSYKDLDEFQAVVRKAMRACLSLQIPLRDHYRRIYVSAPDGLYRDYWLSRLACYLITVHADSSYPAVAEAQLDLGMRSSDSSRNRRR
jgi:hypothetical protein